MKTHTARWHEVERYFLWELRERTQDGGAVLGRIFRVEDSYIWATSTTNDTCASRHAAQRAVRRALAQQLAAAAQENSFHA